MMRKSRSIFGAAEYIRQRMLDERARGAAILLISADLDEIHALSDRIAVMSEGRFMSIMSAEAATANELGLLMAGIRRASAPTIRTFGLCQLKCMDSMTRSTRR